MTSKVKVSISTPVELAHLLSIIELRKAKPTGKVVAHDWGAKGLSKFDRFVPTGSMCTLHDLNEHVALPVELFFFRGKPDSHINDVSLLIPIPGVIEGLQAWAFQHLTRPFVNVATYTHISAEQVANYNI